MHRVRRGGQIKVSISDPDPKWLSGDPDTGQTKTVTKKRGKK
jgi:hypothetical protein